MTIHALLASGTAAIVHPAGCGALSQPLPWPAPPPPLSHGPHPFGRAARDGSARPRSIPGREPAGPPVSAELKAQVLAGLPRRGIVEDLDDGARRKLAGLAAGLEAPSARTSVYAIKVIDVPHAFVGLHERTVVLISLPALRLMSEDELRACRGPRNGPRVRPRRIRAATAAGRRGRLQDLELVCDIIAVMTLSAIGQEARSLPGAIEKFARFNTDHFGCELDGSGLPDLPASSIGDAGAREENVASRSAPVSVSARHCTIVAAPPASASSGACAETRTCPGR